jgi:O-6-methylguanine DNA methyltransferase
MNVNTSNYGLLIRTRDGEFLAWYSDKGLCALQFPSSARRSKGSLLAGPVPARIRAWHAATVAALERALSGHAEKKLPPLDLSAGTHFQQRVWRTLGKIKLGRTWSYWQVAKAVGNPKAVRAVGGACGANPIPVLVPCHRVVAADRGLGGFSGGLNWKRALLSREGIDLPE